MQKLIMLVRPLDADIHPYQAVLPPQKILQLRPHLRRHIHVPEYPTSIQSLYLMYQYFVAGDIRRLRKQVRYFYRNPQWEVQTIEDPEDPDFTRLAILAGLTYYLCETYNEFARGGFPRGTEPGMTPKRAKKLRSKPIFLEQMPRWAREASPANGHFVITDVDGSPPDINLISAKFRELQIWAIMPDLTFLPALDPT